MNEDIFARLNRSAFRSRFKLSPADKDYVREKGGRRFAAMPKISLPVGWLRPIFPMTAGRRRCAATRSLLPSMLPEPAAGNACKNGTE